MTSKIVTLLAFTNLCACSTLTKLELQAQRFADAVGHAAGRQSAGGHAAGRQSAPTFHAIGGPKGKVLVYIQELLSLSLCKAHSLSAVPIKNETQPLCLQH